MRNKIPSWELNSPPSENSGYWVSLLHVSELSGLSVFCKQPLTWLSVYVQIFWDYIFVRSVYLMHTPPPYVTTKPQIHVMMKMVTQSVHCTDKNNHFVEGNVVSA